MDVTKILNADILDIIFDGRNKEYGAYDLRKTYHKRIIIALVAMLVLCGLAYGASLLGGVGKGKPTEIPVLDVNLVDIKPDEKKPVVPPPPPPPRIELPKVEIAKFTSLKIVKDEEVKDPPPEQKELTETKIGVIKQVGIKTDVVAPPVEVKGTGGVEAPKVEEDYTQVFTTVQIQAKFPGGSDEWIKFLQRNLRRDVPVENGAAPGKYTVIVSFLVDKEGNISEVKAENDPGFGTANEAVRVIQRGPKWTPAVQNGRNVIYRQKQSITFVINEG